jgi:DNA-binding response OmpR family regulator
MLSGNEGTADKIKCLKAGADDYLVKPFNPEELEARIANILRRIKKI